MTAATLQQNAARVIAFDLDTASLDSLRGGLPQWELEVVNGANVASLRHTTDLGVANLLVVMANNDLEAVGLCRGLRSQAGWAHTPLLVLVGSAQEALVTAALKAGADSCLVLPINAKDVASMVARTEMDDHSGRHTLNLDPAQKVDQWQDDGGQG